MGEGQVVKRIMGIPMVSVVVEMEEPSSLKAAVLLLTHSMGPKL